MNENDEGHNLADMSGVVHVNGTLLRQRTTWCERVDEDIHYAVASLQWTTKTVTCLFCARCP